MITGQVLADAGGGGARVGGGGFVGSLLLAQTLKEELLPRGTSGEGCVDEVLLLEVTPGRIGLLC